MAAANSGLGALVTALGVNLSTLLFDISAFLVFAWLLSKLVFPVLTRAVDERRNEIAATTRFKNQAEAALAATEAAAAKRLDEARVDAAHILVEAHNQATEIMKAAHDKAEVDGKRALQEAQQQLAQDIADARIQLKSELAKLVAIETAAVLGDGLSDSMDAKLIARRLKESQL